ncbi:acyl-[acyl-carrier-protein] thioesterase [Algoriphagus machipongonensis]|uniref:Acyl-ACP thioesterase family protein n=1 Tax=Algoriphagus machipongonensis TaxID=388413 RepID=A3I1F1_9BACT|nr:acyl-ACP thioesterase domain-containing protein [Algoriphagus machipongonensis]EAZ79617.1 putative acyl-ACP thioesterase family protein [Algoriphagus machipongonensis]
MSHPSTFQYEKDFEIGSFQVHPDGKTRLSSVADLFQEISWRHADSADFGRNLFEENKMWVLSRMDFHCFEFPSWGDRVKVYTAGRGVEKLFAFREFLMTDLEGKVLVQCMTSYLLLNIDSKRPVRPETALPGHLFDPLEKPEWQSEKVEVGGELLFTESRKVRYSDLDLYDHVNNTSYIQWVENLLKEQNLSYSNLLINFQAECKQGDLVTLQVLEKEDSFVFEGKVEGKIVFLAEAY